MRVRFCCCLPQWCLASCDACRAHDCPCTGWESSYWYATSERRRQNWVPWCRLAWWRTCDHWRKCYESRTRESQSWASNGPPSRKCWGQGRQLLATTLCLSCSWCQSSWHRTFRDLARSSSTPSWHLPWAFHGAPCTSWWSSPPTPRGWACAGAWLARVGVDHWPRIRHCEHPFGNHHTWPGRRS